MTKHSMTKSTFGQSARQVPGAIPNHPLERLLALIREWQNRLQVEHSLGHLSEFHLRDVGLTKDDVEAACADSYDHSASDALRSAVQSRVDNW